MKTHLLRLAFLLALPCLPLAAVPAHADVPVIKGQHMTDQDKADLNRMSDYLNGIHNMQADFIQIDEAGGIMHGVIQIQRPGKMRVTYSPPSKDFIVADGSFVHIWNNDLKAQTNVEEGSSLAEFILRDPVSLSGDVTVTKFERFPAKLEITLVQTKDPSTGTLTLVFEDKPLQLRQWKVVDPEGHLTGVSLQNVTTDVSFPSNTFSFVSPNFGK